MNVGGKSFPSGSSPNRAKAAVSLFKYEKMENEVVISVVLKKKKLNDKVTVTGCIRRPEYGGYPVDSSTNQAYPLEQEFTSMGKLRAALNAQVEGLETALMA